MNRDTSIGLSGFAPIEPMPPVSSEPAPPSIDVSEPAPPAPVAVANWPPPPPSAKDRRRGFVAFVLFGLVAMVAAWELDQELDDVASNVLVKADFEHGAEPFLTGGTDEYELAVIDGTYRLRAKAVPSSPLVSFAMTTRAVHAIDVSARVVAVTDPSADAVIGIACEDLPKTNHHAYEFLVSSYDYTILALDAGSAEEVAVVETPTAWPEGGHELRITCRQVGEDAEIHGYIDGVEVIHGVDADGFTTYRAVAVEFMPFEAGDEVRFDDVLALEATQATTSGTAASSSGATPFGTSLPPASSSSTSPTRH